MTVRSAASLQFPSSVESAPESSYRYSQLPSFAEVFSSIPKCQGPFPPPGVPTVLVTAQSGARQFSSPAQQPGSFPPGVQSAAGKGQASFPPYVAPTAPVAAPRGTAQFSYSAPQPGMVPDSMTNRGPVFQNPHAVVFARQTGALQPVQVFAPVDVQFTPPEATARGILDAGNRSLAQGDFDSALHLYRQGLAFASRAPQNQTIGDVIIDLCIREGLVLLKTGKSPIDALAVYFKGMQVPHCSAARKCILWANIGKAQMQIADYYPAIASFEKSLESQQISSQNRAKWNFYIGHCYVQSGNLQLGIQHFNYGLQVEGASAETRALLQNHMGTAYLKMGMMAEAKSYLYQTVSNPAGVPPDLIAEASVFLSDILRNESRTLIENASQLPNLSRELKAILGQKLEKL